MSTNLKCKCGNDEPKNMDYIEKNGPHTTGVCKICGRKFKHLTKEEKAEVDAAKGTTTP